MRQGKKRYVKSQEGKTWGGVLADIKTPIN
jgi:hypothetical protein